MDIKSVNESNVTRQHKRVFFSPEKKVNVAIVCQSRASVWEFARLLVYLNLRWFVVNKNRYLLPVIFVIITKRLNQWFSNCGTRTNSGTPRHSKWYANRPFCFFSKNNIFTTIVCTFRILLINSWNFVHFPCQFFRMVFIISLFLTAILFMLHLRQFWFCKLLIQWYMSRLGFPGKRWYAATVRDPQMVGSRTVRRCRFGDGRRKCFIRKKFVFQIQYRNCLERNFKGPEKKRR